MASKTGLFVFHDSGAPPGQVDYTTVVVLHGYAWHSAIFTPLLPFAQKHNARIILVNRRDYPGTVPYPDSERALLPSLTDDSLSTPEKVNAARGALLLFMKHRAHELLELLAETVRDRGIPPAARDRNGSTEAGGFVVVGWSLGIIWMTALLAHARSFPRGDVDLSRYIRRVVLYDGPSFEFGYPRPADPFDPFLDPTAFSGSDKETLLLDWVSGYFAHGATLGTLERRSPLRDPPPTLRTMSAEARRDTVFRPPGDAGGSDQLLVIGGYRVGLFEPLRRGAFYRERDEEVSAGGKADVHSDKGGDEDEDGDAALWEVEVRAVWCDMSTWEAIHGTWSVRAEVAEAREAGRAVRNVRTARLQGGNHFAHWELPEETLRVFLARESELEE